LLLYIQFKQKIVSKISTLILKITRWFNHLTSLTNNR